MFAFTEFTGWWETAIDHQNKCKTTTVRNTRKETWLSLEGQERLHIEATHEPKICRASRLTWRRRNGKNGKNMSKVSAERKPGAHWLQVSGCWNWVDVTPFPEMGALEGDKLDSGGICGVRVTKLSYMKTPSSVLARLVVLKCSFICSLPNFPIPTIYSYL